MKFSLCADILSVSVGPAGPVWADTDGIIAMMDKAKAHGLDGVELFSLANRDLGKLKAAADARNLSIFAAVPDKGVLLGDPKGVAELTENFRQYVQWARELSCPALVLNAEAYDRTLPHEEVKQLIIDTVKTLSELAGDITILLEPLTGGFYRDAEEAFDIIRAIDRENVKLTFDIFHFQNICGQISQSIEANLPLIGDIHGAGCPTRCELTTGEIDYSYMLKFLNDIGYDGNFCLEFLTFDGRDEKIAASCALFH